MIPKFQSFFKMILEVLADREIHKKSSISNDIARRYNISQDDLKEQTKRNSGLTKFEDRISWAIVYLLKADMISRVHTGHYKITEKGTHLLSLGYDKIDNFTLGQHSEQFAKYQYMRTGKKPQKRNG